MDVKTLFVLILIVGIGIIGILFSILGSRLKNGLSAQSMYNIASCLVVASIISGTISFAAIALTLGSGCSVNYSHQDVVVDILAVLVTILMGWNIISLVDIKKEASRISSVSKDMESVVRSILQLSIHSFTMRKEKEAVIDSCFKSLDILRSCQDDQIKVSVQREVMEVLHYIKSLCDDDSKIKVYNQKQLYLYILNNTDSPYTKEIRKMIRKASFAEQQESMDFAEAVDEDSRTDEANGRDTFTTGN